ncbi:MAG TPA: ABC transporter [Sutterella sp.]|nr:ABC transporter [Sutterella sp.]
MKKALAVICLCSMLAGCAQIPPTSGQDPSDPWESFNRQTYAFNTTLDDYVLKPVATVYKNVVPNPVRSSVTNFFNNLTEPRNFVNGILQGRPDKAARSFFRFIVNTTIGIAGLFDVATHLDLEAAPEDFGQTLAVWGVGDGPYLVLPFLGSSTLRDTAGTVVDLGTAPQTYIAHEEPAAGAGLYAVEIVNTRASLIGPDEILNSAIDPYVAVRNAYQQSRKDAIYDGNPPMDFPEDEFEDEE